VIFAIPPLSPSWRAFLKRVDDILTVYGHGLLAFGVGKFFVGEVDIASSFAIGLGLACHGGACYISYLTER
jgi:hypothetical protein